MADVTIQFGQITIDCEHADTLAVFYSDLLERPIAESASDYYARIPASEDPPFPALLFLKVGEPPTGKNRLHLDLFTTDRDATMAKALRLGGRHHSDHDEWNMTWTTLIDPEGNVFDVGYPHD